MKEYTPGQGSYKVEEGGALTGIATSYNVDNNWGTLVFDRDDVKVPARGLDLALSSRFNSDHLYSAVIAKVSKNDGPADGLGVSRPVPKTLMTLPFDQANFYRFAQGWSWNLPFLIWGLNILKYAPGDGKIFDLLSAITYEAWGGVRGGKGNHSWTEGYEVTYESEDAVTLISRVSIVIPEVQSVMTLNVQRSNDTLYNFTPLYDDALAVYLADGRVTRFTSKGLIASVTDAAGVNSLTYSYDSDALTGTVQSSSSRKTFCIDADDYAGVTAGDLIVIGDEIRVVFSKDNDDNFQISVSNNFDIALPPGVGPSYSIVKGKLREIVHTDGRAVKFYYPLVGGVEQLAIVLSSDSDMEHFAVGDQFLGYYTRGSQQHLLSYSACQDLGHSGTTEGFFNTLEADLNAAIPTYFTRLQTVNYRYSVTNAPTPQTDSIVVTNPAGAPSIYYFQAGGFCSHSWNNAYFHRGTCRRGGTKKILNIERPDFYVSTGNYVNLNRIDEKAFREASKDDYQMDENAAEFRSENEFNENMFLAGQVMSRGTDFMGQIQHDHQQKKYARDRRIAANAGNVTKWVKVTKQTSSNRLELAADLTELPRQNDVFGIVNLIGDADKLADIDKTSRNSTRVYVDYRGTNGPDFQAGDFVFLRTESGVIASTGTESFGVGGTKYYIEVENAFSFNPCENEQVLFVYNNGGKLPANAQYYCYYLNKPKVVRVELLDSSTEFSSSWKVIDYEYNYEVQGTTMTDDFDFGGFSEDHIEGPARRSFDVSDIALRSTVVTTGTTNGKETKELYKDVFTFQYDEKNFHKGQDSETRLRQDEGGNWLFVKKTVNQLGRPCFNAGYYGVTARYFYEGGNVAVGDGGAQWRKKVDYRYDVYGRVVRTRTSSTSLEGRRAQISYTQWVGSSRAINDVDPLNVFEGNYMAREYQNIFDAKHALGIVGATIEEVDAQQNAKITYHAYHPDTLNLILTHVSVVPSLESYQDILSLNAPNFSVDSAGTDETDPTKINWSYGAVANSTDWSTVKFDTYTLTAAALTEYTYDFATNNLTSIRKPHGNLIHLAYGTSWKSSFVTLDWKKLDQNLGGTTQYVVTSYDYDLKGRMITKTVRLKTDTADSDTNLQAWGDSAPKSVTNYTWDGMDRLLTKSLGDGTSQNVVARRQFKDEGDSLWPHPYMIVTDSLGLRTKTFYDSRYRVIQTQKFKPNQDIAGDLNYNPAWEVKIASQWNVNDIGVDKVAQTIVYTDPDEATAHSVVTKNTYDAIGRLLRVEHKNYDAKYQGDSVFHVVQDLEYDENKNAVVTKVYLNAEGDYRQTRVENDWLGRGAIKEIVWTGINATGVTRTTTHSYRHDGKKTKTTLPNGQSIRFQYDNLGKLEKITHPDGTRETMLYDLNQNLVQTINRRNLSTSMTYNDADVEVTRTTRDAVRGDKLVVTTYTPFGPASIVETEGGDPAVEADFEYHWSGQVSLRKQIVDGHTMKVAYAYDALGNRTSMTPTGSGSSAWTKQLDILPVFHAASPDTDHFNRTAIADHSSGDNLVTIEPDFTGLTSSLKYGNFTSPAVGMDYTYDRYLKPVTLKSSDSPKSLELTLTRDFSGNIVGKNEPAWGSVPAVADIYAYDGMNRLVSGEAENNTFDELSNIVGKGMSRYIYEDPDDVGGDQMRLESFHDGTDHAYTYDADGNITAIGSRFTSLSYDNLGKLREIVGSQTDQYWYDRTGLRVKKIEDVGGTPVTTYTMFEGNNPLMQEVYEGSTRKAVWFQILSGEQILARVGKNYPSSEFTLYFALDNLGSRRAVFDSSGAVIDRYRYSAWGVATQDAGSDSLASFTAKDYDASGLLYFNARFYDAVTGRFLSEDPARKGSGWYSYCEGNPVNATDPTGLDLTAAQVKSGHFSTSTAASQQGYSLGPGKWVKVSPDKPLIVASYSGGAPNNAGAQKGTLSVYTAEQVTSSGFVNLNATPAVSVPAVSGATNVAPTPSGTYSNLKTEKVSTSPVALLSDANHGGPDNTMIRLPGTNGDAFHQGHNGANQDTAYSEGCFVVTSSPGSSATPEMNYNMFKNAVGGADATAIVH